MANWGKLFRKVVYASLASWFLFKARAQFLHFCKAFLSIRNRFNHKGIASHMIPLSRILYKTPLVGYVCLVIIEHAEWRRCILNYTAPEKHINAGNIPFWVAPFTSIPRANVIPDNWPLIACSDVNVVGCVFCEVLYRYCLVTAIIPCVVNFDCEV